MNKLILLATVAIVSALHVPAANAACLGSGIRKEIVGQVPSITFRAGVAQTKWINPVYVGWVQAGNWDCGNLVRSMTSDITPLTAYGSTPGTPIPTGTWGPITNSGIGLSGSFSPAPARFSGGFGVMYDGSSPAGSVRQLEIAQNVGDDVQQAARIIGYVNVYITADGLPPQEAFIITGNTRNVSGNRLLLSHPLLDFNPAARLFVSHVREPSGGVSMSWNRPVSVTYDVASSRWAIQNDDGGAMPVGIAFAVRIDPAARTVSPIGRFGQAFAQVTINDPRANGNPDAIILVTPADSNPHPLAVRYVAPYWRIVNGDGSSIPANTRFFVQIYAVGAYRDDGAPIDPYLTNEVWSNGVGVDINSNSSRAQLDTRFLDFYWTRSSVATMAVIVTHNQTPRGRAVVTNARYIGVRFTGSAAPANTWSVYHESGASMAKLSPFNVWAPYQAQLSPY